MRWRGSILPRDAWSAAARPPPPASASRATASIRSICRSIAARLASKEGELAERDLSRAVESGRCERRGEERREEERQQHGERRRILSLCVCVCSFFSFSLSAARGSLSLGWPPSASSLPPSLPPSLLPLLFPLLASPSPPLSSEQSIHALSSLSLSLSSIDPDLGFVRLLPRRTSHISSRLYHLYKPSILSSSLLFFSSFSRREEESAREDEREREGRASETVPVYS